MGIVLKVPVTLRQQLNMSYKRAIAASEILSGLTGECSSSGAATIAVLAAWKIHATSADMLAAPEDGRSPVAGGQ